MEANNKKWNFTPVHARDVFNTKTSGSVLRSQAEIAAKSANLSWKEVLNMTYKELMEFLAEFSKAEGLDEFSQFSFLGKE